MRKIILLDADGVVLRGRHKYFSQRFSEEKGVSLDLILPFFKGDFLKAQIGEMDIKTILPGYLNAWGWEGDVDSFLKYWFSGESEIDSEMLDQLRYLKEKSGVHLYLATDQEKHRASYLWNDLGLKNDFDGSFFSCDLGVRKSNGEFFNKIFDALIIKAGDEIYFWDDDEKNVEVARGMGIEAEVFTDVSEWRDAVREILGE
jgi:putative hydrolase of the HAD superfamily